MWVQGNWPARVRTRKSEQRHKQSRTIVWEMMDGKDWTADWERSQMGEDG